MNKVLFSMVCFATTVFHAKAQDNTIPTTVVDADSNVYQTVTIGTQIWMSENLKTTKYYDGTSIPQVSDDAAWSNLYTPGYCWYKNDQSNYGNTYGGLYNWYTVETGNLCPTGWHVPTDAEWTVLTDYLGGLSVAGGKLKETDTTHWNEPNTGATNETGFTALPGGHRGSGGKFNGIREHGGWWSSSEDGTNAYGRVMGYDYEHVVGGTYDHGKQGGFSVRCVWDLVIGIEHSGKEIRQGMLHLYPNPASNYITVDVDRTNGASGVLEILTLEGRVLKSEQVASRQKVFIDVSTLSSGIYLCRYTVGTSSKTTKIVKL